MKVLTAFKLLNPLKSPVITTEVDEEEAADVAEVAAEDAVLVQAEEMVILLASSSITAESKNTDPSLCSKQI